MIRPIPALAFVAASSGAGKTALIENLIILLKARGYRVGAVKHTAHDAAVDREGSDSRRFSEAGSDVTVLAAPGRYAVVKPSRRCIPDEVLGEASRGTDIVLLEGFREAEMPKIEVFRSGHSEDLCCRKNNRKDPYLVAVASDVPLDIDVPVLDINDAHAVCAFIVERFLR